MEAATSKPQFIGERIDVEAGSFDAGLMERGEPGVPRSFRWRHQRFGVVRITDRRRQLGEDRGDRYVRRHVYDVETSDGLRMTLHFERNPSDRSRRKAWWLYTLTLPEPVIVTQRVALRRWTYADRDAFLRMVQDPQVMAHVHDFEPMSDRQAREALDATIRRYEIGYGDWAVMEPQHGDILGEAGLTPLPDATEITWMFFGQHWGKGYAREVASAVQRYAFETLHLARIVARVRAENDRSAKVAEAIGMRLARRFKDDRGEEMLEYACARPAAG